MTLNDVGKMELKFRVMMILGLVTREGVSRVPTVLLSLLFCRLQSEFHGLFPDLVFSGSRTSVSSRRLSDVFDELNGVFLYVDTTDIRYTNITDDGTDILDRLGDPQTLRALEPVAIRFCQLLDILSADFDQA